jgi:hypothetical protein
MEIHFQALRAQRGVANAFIPLDKAADLVRASRAIVWNRKCYPEWIMIQKLDGCAESRRWIARFSLRSMTAIYVSHLTAAELTREEIATITKSIQQFQLGEGSKGQRLLNRGRKYGRSVSDPFFVAALDLFIKEEQQHSRYLEAFMQSQGIAVAGRHWVDTVFRKLRGLAGLELSLAVLVTAEFIAVPYYRALRDATGSAVLKTICKRILDDEATHLRYQASMMARLTAQRRRVFDRVRDHLHRFFLLSTMVVVWFEHRAVFQAAGYGFRRLQEETLFEFTEWDSARRTLALQFAAPGAHALRLPEEWSPAEVSALRSSDAPAAH